MPKERTLAIIKPDAMARRLEGKVIDRMLDEDFRIVAMKKIKLDKYEAGCFYEVHRGQYFFEDLTTFMSSDEMIVLVLEKDDAIHAWREVLGTTDPAKAADGTIRHTWGTAMNRNICHGSDSPENAAHEIAFFFSGLEITRSGKEEVL